MLTYLRRFNKKRPVYFVIHLKPNLLTLPPRPSEAPSDQWIRTICIVDAHRGDGKRFIARADGKLTVFLGRRQLLGHRNQQVSQSLLGNFENP
jgi:hypothetical protein